MAIKREKTIKKYKTVRNVTPMWFKDYDCDTNVTAILQLTQNPLIFDFYSVILCSSKTTAVTTRYVTVILQITFLVD